MSRFGRNYLQVGFYTEIQFPQKGVRFIAINNGVDSDNPTENDFTPFLNIMNEWYAKDTSNKIKAVFKQRMSNGLRCSGSIPYGYRREPGDKQTLYIDEEAAAVVRRIFNMAADGASMGAIAEALTKDKVLIPSAYLEQRKEGQARCHNYRDPYRWSNTTVGYILNRQECLGHTVLCKTICDSFKTKKRRKARSDEMLIFPDTHEAIIDQETFDKAQRLIKRNPKKVASGTYTHRLSGLVYCGDCGARMGYSSPEASGRPDLDSSSSFQCGNYRNVFADCTSHYIKASTLERAVLEAIYNLLHILYYEEYDEFFGFQPSGLKTPNQTDVERINKKLQPFFCRTTKNELNVPLPNSDSIIPVPASVDEEKIFRVLLKKHKKNKLLLMLRILQLESND